MDTPAVEYSSLYKFLVSAGVLSLVADGLMVWSLVQRSDLLLTKDASLSELTQAGKSGVESQQALLYAIVRNLPWVAAVVAVIGIGLIVWGLLLWRPQQKVQDAIERSRLADHVSPATLADVDDRIDSEAAEEAAEELVDRPYRGRGDFSARLAQAQEQYRAIEVVAADLFRRAFQATHSVESELKLTKDGSPVAYLDLLVTARDLNGVSYVVEIKLSARRLSERRLTEVLVATGRSAIVASSFLERPVRGLVFLVVSEPVASSVSWAGWPEEDGDPRNSAATLIVSRQGLEEMQGNPSILSGVVESQSPHD